MSEELKLLPCPFCGQHLEHNENLSTRSAKVYFHPRNDETPCIAESIGIWDKDPARITAWNRRSPLVGAGLDATAAKVRAHYFAFTGQPHGSWDELGRPEVTQGEAIREKWREIVRMARGEVTPPPQPAPCLVDTSTSPADQSHRPKP